MELEHDIENMTLNEYLKYEAEKEMRLRMNVRFKRSPTKYKEADFDTFHRDKSGTFNYMYYHGLPPLHPCFQSAQPYNEDGLEYSIKIDQVDIDSMIIAEYESYITKQGLKKKPLNGYSCRFTSNFCDQSSYAPNPQPNDEELSFKEEYNNWDITIEDIERLRQLFTPSVHTLPEPDPVVQPCVPLLPSPDEVMAVRDEEPNNDSIYVPNVMDDLIQPLIPQVIHTTPPDKDYLAPATKSILDEILEEFRDEIVNVTVVDEEADCNPTKDI
uniref:Uncharacterized protein n=1 Tax=Tanacetum cinerariifolium TaxID=118510 RepID=A0A6L2M983_TANCI|nr:hypothetical protein [Tanacetum cinerariifolium]